MIAVFETGGKQYLVSPGDKIKIEKINKSEGEDVVFDRILLLEDGGNVKIGKPLLEKASVKGKVIKQGRGKKVIVFKHKPKKRYRVKNGHRQYYTEVEILDIKG